MWTPTTRRPHSRDESGRTGRWSGTALELWVTLFIEHRRIRHGGYEPSDEERPRLDGLCRALRDRLVGRG
jgi:hypothetical protein